MGCSEISLGDTIGVGTPGNVSFISCLMFCKAILALAAVLVYLSHLLKGNGSC